MRDEAIDKGHAPHWLTTTPIVSRILEGELSLISIPPYDESIW